jgi:hypothetical protein
MLVHKGHLHNQPFHPLSFGNDCHVNILRKLASYSQDREDNFTLPSIQIQDRIEQAFRAEWCHLGIFGVDCVTIVWCFLPPLYFLDFFNV